MARWRLEAARRSRRVRAGSPPAAGSPFPAFDLRGYHPIGWPRGHDGRVGALGPPELLPVGTAPAGKKAVGPVPAGNLRRLRRFHHLEDLAAFHEDERSRAAALARLAAAGVVIHLADESEPLREILGDDLYRLFRTDPTGRDPDGVDPAGLDPNSLDPKSLDPKSLDPTDPDPAAREVHAARMRRVALRQHSTWARARRDGEREFPRVSVLLATRRPGFLPWALANLARQTYPNRELILGLHGDGFPAVEPLLRDLRHPARVVRAPRDEPLGAVLNALAEAAEGPLLTKMDDDDLYGADHLRDLVLAREFSGAALVGKWLEFVYLAEADCTMQWCNGESERFQTTTLSGPTLLLSRSDLDRAGGFRPLAGGVDPALTRDVVAAGGRVYRTHGAGFLLVRHRRGHTWDSEPASDAGLLARADRIWPGFHPARAGIEPLPVPHPGLAEAGTETAGG